MKNFGKLVLFVAALLGAAYVGGVFEVEAEVKVNQDMRRDVSGFTHDKLESVQKGTNRAFDTLKKQLKDD